MHNNFLVYRRTLCIRTWNNILCIHTWSFSSMLVVHSKWFPQLWHQGRSHRQVLSREHCLYRRPKVLQHALYLWRPGNYCELQCCCRCNVDIESWNHNTSQKNESHFSALCTVPVSNVDIPCWNTEHFSQVASGMRTKTILFPLFPQLSFLYFTVVKLDCLLLWPGISLCQAPEFASKNYWSASDHLVHSC